MGILKVEAFDVKIVSSGITMSGGTAKGGDFFRIGMNVDAQKRHFERVLNPQEHAFALTVTDMPQQRHLMGIKLVMLDEPGALPLASGARDSVFVKVKAWTPTQGKRPAVSLTVVNQKVQGGGFSVKLPEWARPPVDPRERGKG